MKEIITLHLVEEIKKFTNRFSLLNDNFDKGIYSYSETNSTIDDYTTFILDESNKKAWEVIEKQLSRETKQLIEAAQRESAYCVWNMEKYRAKELINNKKDITDYFKNIENCIDNEFGCFKTNGKSKILMIGSGAFPMTPLLIARNTGAEIVGIDIDEETVVLGGQVINVLGKELNIKLSLKKCSELDFIQEATHIIFASTIPEKFEILEEIYDLTNEDVVVVMRYGNGLKSLFNYPLVESMDSMWEKVDEINYNNNIFDVAIYKKRNK